MHWTDAQAVGGARMPSSWVERQQAPSLAQAQDDINAQISARLDREAIQTMAAAQERVRAYIADAISQPLQATPLSITAAMVDGAINEMTRIRHDADASMQAYPFALSHFRPTRDELFARVAAGHEKREHVPPPAPKPLPDLSPTRRHINLD